MCRWGLIRTPTLLCQWECGPGLAWTVNVVSHVYRVATKDTHEVHIWQLEKGELLKYWRICAVIIIDLVLAPVEYIVVYSPVTRSAGSGVSGPIIILQYSQSLDAKR